MKFLAITNELFAIISVLDQTQRVHSDERLPLLSSYYLDLIFIFSFFFLFKLHYLFLTTLCSQQHFSIQHD